MGTSSEIKGKIKYLETGMQGYTPLTNIELGILYQINKNYNKAEEAFKKAIAALPSNAYPRFLLLKLYNAKGEKDKAKDIAKEIILSGTSKMSTAMRSGLQALLDGYTGNTEEFSQVDACESALA
jgi:uncharacterized protein HemY